MRTAIAAGGNRDAALLGAGELVTISMELLSAQGWCFCRSTADRTSSFPTLILRVTKLNNILCVKKIPLHFEARTRTTLAAPDSDSPVAA